MKAGEIVDLIIGKNLSVAVKILRITPSKKFAYIGNISQPESESFKVSIDKLTT